MTETCPHCAVPLDGDPVPDRAGEYYSLKIGVEVLGKYDGALFWRCPACSGNWHRWPEGDYRRAQAAEYVGVP